MPLSVALSTTTFGSSQLSFLGCNIAVFCSYTLVSTRDDHHDGHGTTTVTALTAITTTCLAGLGVGEQKEQITLAVDFALADPHLDTEGIPTFVRASAGVVDVGTQRVQEAYDHSLNISERAISAPLPDDQRSVS